MIYQHNFAMVNMLKSSSNKSFFTEIDNGTISIQVAVAGWTNMSNLGTITPASVFNNFGLSYLNL